MQLHAAAARGDTDGIAFALRNGTDINARNAIGQTALVFALNSAKAFSRRKGPMVTVDALEALLNAGIDLEICDSLGATAIHHAAGVPDLTLFDTLVKRGANLKHVTQSGYSVLTHACYQPASPRKLAMVQKLSEAGASLNTISEYGEFPLGVCLRFGDFETLRLLIDLGADAGPLNWDPLHCAVVFGDAKDVERLRPTSGMITTPNLRFELSPWLLAFRRGEVDIIRLLANGADLTQSGRGGETPLHASAEFGQLEALKWLLDQGADPNARNEFAKTPLHFAAAGNHIECARELVNRDANPVHANNVQSQPIHAAHSVEMIQLLVELGGADINTVDGCGDWPLKSAAEFNDVPGIRWMLENGAAVDRNSTGATALHAAVQADSREAVDLLLKAGADPNAQDVDGWTPLFSAISREVIHNLRKAGANSCLTDDIGAGPERWLGDPILVHALRKAL